MCMGGRGMGKRGIGVKTWGGKGNGREVWEEQGKGMREETVREEKIVETVIDKERDECGGDRREGDKDRRVGRKENKRK